MTDKQHFIDSNIWLYRLLDDERMTVEERARKHQIATEVIDSGNSLIISVQVINEVCSNLLRKKRITELEIQTTIEDFYEICNVVELNQEILMQASKLRQRYSFSFWDGLIVASALVAKAEILYSEDMQHGLQVENQIQIINPFR
jgi:predicted nucleic acid-binding protein